MTKKREGALLGRPRKWKITSITETPFNSHNIETLIKLMSEGLWDAQIQAYLDISERIFNRWLQEEPEFQAAYELGIPKRINYWLTTGKEKLKAEGDKGLKTYAYFIDHMMPKDMKWESDRKGVSINIQNNLSQEIKTESELLESIKTNFSSLFDHQKTQLIQAVPELKVIANNGQKDTSANRSTIGTIDPETEV